jgi:hypothetical protein
MVLTQWRECYVIPEPNDLSAEAKSVLFHVGNWAGDAETLLLITLPRAIGAVGRPVRQWERFDLLETYVGALRQLIVEISNYEPVTPATYNWMVGTLRVLDRTTAATPPRERTRLIELVAKGIGAWLRDQRLPAFVADLSADDLHGMFPDADAQTIAALIHLLCRDAITVARRLISQDVPVALGLDLSPESWTEQAVDSALERFVLVRKLVERLPNRLREQVLVEIGQIFAPNGTLTSSNDVLSQMREWRAAYVILPDTTLSPDARLLYEALGSVEDDADGLLLRRLPSRISEVRTPYGNWLGWSTRECYLHALRAAASEIVKHGVVGPDTENARKVWSEFRRQLDTLNDDEKRWVLKAFRDEFQQ